MTTTSNPQLAAPGAGLPAPELLIARGRFALKCRTGSRDSFLNDFRREQSEIRRLVNSCPVERRGERVLIPRPRGLEDSSRDWSVWMTLDHLRIVNDGIAGIIAELAEGKIREELLGTADVKPDPAVTEEVEAAYEASADAFLQRIAPLAELNTEARYPHPWFGPINAFRWLGLASMHMGIHRGQIAAILRGLNL